MDNKFTLCSELENEITLYSRKVPTNGGEAEIVQIRQGGHVIATFCECGGQRKNCPTPQFPSCDCTQDPPVLTCG